MKKKKDREPIKDGHVKDGDYCIVKGMRGLQIAKDVHLNVVLVEGVPVSIPRANVFPATEKMVKKRGTRKRRSKFRMKEMENTIYHLCGCSFIASATLAIPGEKRIVVGRDSLPKIEEMLRQSGDVEEFYCKVVAYQKSEKEAIRQGGEVFKKRKLLSKKPDDQVKFRPKGSPLSDHSNESIFGKMAGETAGILAKKMEEMGNQEIKKLVTELVTDMGKLEKTLYAIEKDRAEIIGAFYVPSHLFFGKPMDVHYDGELENIKNNFCKALDCDMEIVNKIFGTYQMLSLHIYSPEEVLHNARKVLAQLNNNDRLVDFIRKDAEEQKEEKKKNEKDALLSSKLSYLRKLIADKYDAKDDTIELVLKKYPALDNTIFTSEQVLSTIELFVNLLNGTKALNKLERDIEEAKDARAKKVVKF